MHRTVLGVGEQSVWGLSRNRKAEGAAAPRAGWREGGDFGLGESVCPTGLGPGPIPIRDSTAWGSAAKDPPPLLYSRGSDPTIPPPPKAQPNLIQPSLPPL